MQEKELKYIAEHYQTPCFIFDLEAVKERVKKMREIVGGAYQLSILDSDDGRNHG